MRPKEYDLMVDCVREGAAFGVMSAFKHTETPTQDSIVESITHEVMCAICERWRFEDQPTTDQ